MSRPRRSTRCAQKEGSVALRLWRSESSTARFLVLFPKKKGWKQRVGRENEHAR